MREDQVGRAIAVDVRHPAAFGVIAVGNQVALPLDAQLFGILVPEHAIEHPAGRHHVGRAIVVHIHRPLAAVGDKLTQCARLPVLVAFPLATLRAGILIPICTAENIGAAIAVHVEGGDTFRMVRA